MTQDNREQTEPPERQGVDASLMRHGGLSYLEIPAVDVERSSTFYEKVLGWKVQIGADDTRKFSDGTGHLIGRWVIDRTVSRKPGWLPYFYVDQIDAVVERVAKFEGEIVKPIHPEGDVRIAIVRDPAGNLIGLWEEAGG